MVFSKKVLTIALIVIILCLAAYFLVIKGRLNGTDETTEESSNSGQQVSDSPVPVKVATVRRGDLIIKLESPGEAVTNLHVDMKAEVSGNIKKIYVKESQHVKKGDLLIEVDDREYRLALESSEANRLERLSKYLLEQRFGGGEQTSGLAGGQLSPAAAQEFARLEEMYQKGLISREEYQKKRMELDVSLIESGERKEEIMRAAQGVTQAEVEVEQARLNLEKTKIRAPFDGIVTNIDVSNGENISTGADLLTIVNIAQIQVHAKVLESEIGKMKVGREVDLKFSAYPGQVFKGVVDAISPIVDPEDKTCNVIVKLANVNEAIKPGMHAEVEIAAEIYPDRLLVPQDAILSRSARKLVFVVQDGLAKWKYIEVGLENEDFAEVLTPEDPNNAIKPGDMVLVDGHFTLAHDARVRIVQ